MRAFILACLALLGISTASFADERTVFRGIFLGESFADAKLAAEKDGFDVSTKDNALVLWAREDPPISVAILYQEGTSSVVNSFVMTKYFFGVTVMSASVFVKNIANNYSLSFDFDKTLSRYFAKSEHGERVSVLYDRNLQDISVVLVEPDSGAVPSFN